RSRPFKSALYSPTFSVPPSLLREGGQGVRFRRDAALSTYWAGFSATMIIRLPNSSAGDSTCRIISRITSSGGARCPGRRALRAEALTENFIASQSIGTIGALATEVGPHRSV